MQTVNISDLKARLSAHIQMVRSGEELLVCECNRPVARIVPCGMEDFSAQNQRLVARGVLTPPLNKRPASVTWPQPPGEISKKAMEKVWREERENRETNSSLLGYECSCALLDLAAVVIFEPSSQRQEFQVPHSISLRTESP